MDNGYEASKNLKTKYYKCINCILYTFVEADLANLKNKDFSIIAKPYCEV